MIIRAQMLMVNKEAPTNKTRTASPTAIPYSRGQIADRKCLSITKGNGIYIFAKMELLFSGKYYKILENRCNVLSLLLSYKVKLT